MCFPILDTKAVYFYSYGQKVAMTTHPSQRLICWNLSKIISYQRDNIDFSELTTQINISDILPVPIKSRNEFRCTGRG